MPGRALSTAPHGTAGDVDGAEAKRDEAVTHLQTKVADLINKLVVAQAHLGDLVLWCKCILTEDEQQDWKDRLAGLGRSADQPVRVNAGASCAPQSNGPLASEAYS